MGSDIISLSSPLWKIHFNLDGKNLSTPFRGVVHNYPIFSKLIWDLMCHAIDLLGLAYAVERLVVQVAVAIY